MPTKTRPYYFDSRYTYQDLSNGAIGPIQIVGSYLRYGNNSVTADGPVVGWRERIRTGQNATSNLSGTEYRRSCDPASCDYKIAPNSSSSSYNRYRLRGNMMSYYLGSVGTDLSVSSSYLDAADNQARSRFYQNLADVESDFKGQTALGELAETLRMIKRPAQGLRRGVSDYLDRLKKAGPGRSVRDRPKFVRDTWLEYSFGWKPLISDLEDGMTALYTSRWVRPIFRMVSSKGRNGTQPVLSPLSGVSAGINGLWLYFNVETVREAEVKYYGMYHSSGNGPSSFRHYGFSPWEFIPTLWELVPYSFLVDYFTNIGDIISSWSYRNIGVAWAAKGIKIANRIEIRNARIELSNPSYHFVYNTGSPGSSMAEYASKQRIPNVSIPLPDFQFEVPGMGTRWINILALSKQISSTRQSLAR